MDRLCLVGTSHQLIDPTLLATAPSEAEFAAVLDRLQNDDGSIVGSVTLKTCNRVEVYVHLRHPGRAESVARKLAALFGTLPTESRFGADVVRHLIRVAGSLESMVLGENQILAQVKNAWQAGRERETLTTLLGDLFRHAVRAAKEIRTKTRLGTQPVSVASLGARCLRDACGTHRPLVALVGAGTMVRKAAVALDGHADLIFVNRTFEKAVELASRFDGIAIPIDDFQAAPPAVDAVLAGVSTDQPLVDESWVERIQAARADDAPALVLVDLGVPPNIARGLLERDDVKLIDMDALHAKCVANTDERHAAARRAEPIADRYAQTFEGHVRSLDLGLAGVHRAHLELAENEIHNLLEGQFRHLSDSDRRELESKLLGLARAHAHLHLKDLKSKAVAFDGHSNRNTWK